MSDRSIDELSLWCIYTYTFTEIVRVGCFSFIKYIPTTDHDWDIEYAIAETADCTKKGLKSIPCN